MPVHSPVATPLVRPHVRLLSLIGYSDKVWEMQQPQSILLGYGRLVKRLPPTVLDGTC